MQPISQPTIQKIHSEFSGLQTPELRQKAGSLHDEQPELMAFVQASINELDQDAADLAVYLFFMVCRMYQETYGDQLSTATPQEIIERYKENEDLIEQRRQNDEQFTGQDASLSTDQPELMEYITRILKDAESEEREDLSTGEQAYIFLILRSVIQVLNDRIGG